MALNNDREDAVVISGLPFQATQDTSSAFDDDDLSKFARIGKTVWYSLTLTEKATVFVDTYNSDFDTVAVVWTDVGDGTLVQVKANDDGPNHNDYEVRFGSWLFFTAEANQTYLLQLGGYDGLSGELDLRVSSIPFSIPANDYIQDAILVPSFPYANSQNTFNATRTLKDSTTLEPRANTSVDHTVWYGFEFPADTDVVINAVANYRVSLTAWRTDAYETALTPHVAYFYSSSNGGRFAQLRFTALAGQKYALQVGGFGLDQMGDVELSMLVAPPLPLNDDRVDAFTISPLSTTIVADNTGATREADEGGNSSVQASLWWKFSLAERTEVVFYLSGFEFGQRWLAIYPAGSTTAIRWIIPSVTSSDVFRTLRHILPSGDYEVQVGTFSTLAGTMTGPFTVDVTSGPAQPAPSYDTPDGALELDFETSDSGSVTVDTTWATVLDPVSEGFGTNRMNTIYFVLTITGAPRWFTYVFTDVTFNMNIRMWEYNDGVRGTRLFSRNVDTFAEGVEYARSLDPGTYLIGISGTREFGTFTFSYEGLLPPEGIDPNEIIEVSMSGYDENYNYRVCPGGIQTLPWSQLSWTGYHPDSDWSQPGVWAGILPPLEGGEDWHDGRVIETYFNQYTQQTWWLVFYVKILTFSKEEVGPIWRRYNSPTIPETSKSNEVRHTAGNPVPNDSLDDYQPDRAACVQARVLSQRGNMGSYTFNSYPDHDPLIHDIPCDPAPLRTVLWGWGSHIGYRGTNWFSSWFRWGWWPVFWYSFNSGSNRVQTRHYDLSPVLTGGWITNQRLLELLASAGMELTEWTLWQNIWGSEFDDTDWHLEAHFHSVASGRHDTDSQRRHDIDTYRIRKQPASQLDAAVPGNWLAASPGETVYSAVVTPDDEAKGGFVGSGTPEAEYLGERGPSRWTVPNGQIHTLEYSVGEAPEFVFEFTHDMQINPPVPFAPTYADSLLGTNSPYFRFGQHISMGTTYMGSMVSRPFEVAYYVCPEGELLIDGSVRLPPLFEKIYTPGELW